MLFRSGSEIVDPIVEMQAKMNTRLVCIFFLLLLAGQEVANAQTKQLRFKATSRLNAVKRAAAVKKPAKAEKVLDEDAQPLDKGKVNCPDGTKNVPKNQLKECEIKGSDDDDEWTFVGYLQDKKCPAFSKAEVKQAIKCYVDRNPCKEVDFNDLKESFQICNKEKLVKEEEKKSPDAEQNEEEMPDQDRSQPDLTTVMDEDFNVRTKTNTKVNKHNYALGPITSKNWDMKMSQGVFASPKLGGHAGGKAAVFVGNKKGSVFEFPTPKDSRYLTTKEFDAKHGGVISFYLKSGEINGDKMCVEQLDIMMEEYKRQMRAAEATKAKEDCESSPPCNGHGEGVFSSSCFMRGKWVEDAKDVETSQFKCHDKKSEMCLCKCEQGYKEPNCLEVRKPNNKDGFRRCRSVGDPHPNTAAGANFNIYDSGEFVWSRHPDMNVEARLRTRPAGRVAVNRGFSMTICKGDRFPNGKVNDDGKMQGPCETVAMERCSFSLETCDKMGPGQKCKCQKIGRSFTSKLGISVTSSTISANGWSLQYSCGSYMDSYLTINSPRDGRSVGLCGYYGTRGAGGDTGNPAFLSRSGSRGSHHMTSRKFYDSSLTTKKGEDSHFRCVGYVAPGVNPKYPNFHRISSSIGTSAEMGMKMAAEALTQEYARDRAWSLARMSDPIGDEVSTAEAEKICKETIIKCSGLPVPDVSAMTACVADYVKVGKEDGKSVLKGACEVVKEDEDNAEEDIKMDEAEEKLEMASAAPLRVPGKNDLVVQWCVKDCDKEEKKACVDARAKMRDTKGAFTPKEVNAICNWKQIKAFPAKLYKEWTSCPENVFVKLSAADRLTCGFRPMTLSIPPEAIKAQKDLGKKMRVRFFQERHECYCCNTFAVDSVKINTGGWPVRCMADSDFSLFADGKEVGAASNNWVGYKWNPMRDTYRFRISPKSKVLGARIVSEGNGRAGLICSVGESLVTSSTWRCSDGDAPKIGVFSKPDFDASLWPAAAEIGRNMGEGVQPWGQIPGIATKAFWIYDHNAYKKGGSVANCRVDTRRAYHSYSIEHKAASRWSCQADRDRQSPFIIQMTENNMDMAAVLANDLDSTANKAVNLEQSIVAYGGPGSLKKQYGRYGIGADKWHRDRKVSFAALPIDPEKKQYPKSSIMLRIKAKKIVAMTAQGAQVKVAKLRLFVTDASSKPFQYCKSSYNWNAGRVNYNTFNRTIFPYYLSDCRTATASKENEFISLDITEWMRDWITGGKVNGGIAILFDGGDPPKGDAKKADALGFATFKMSNKEASMRPRLSLSCHGDRVEPTVVFKENRAVSGLKANGRKLRKQ